MSVRPSAQSAASPVRKQKPRTAIRAGSRICTSPILQLTATLYRELFASEPKIHAVHAGLECGVLSARVAGGLDAVSFGPNIKGNHAPGERVEIRSVQKSYPLLTATLARLAREDMS